MVVIGVALLGLAHLSSNWDADPDSVSYLSIARSIAHGRLERLGTPHLLYEPTYPALIAPAFWMPGSPFLWISVIHACISAALVGGVWYWCAAYSRERAIFVSLLTVGNIGLWMMHRVVRPEIAYMGATVWAGGLIARGFRDVGTGRYWGWMVAGGAVAALAAAFRPLPFVSFGTAGALIYLGWRGRVGWGRAFVGALIVAVMSAAVMVTWMKVDRAMSSRAAEPSELDERVKWTYIDYVRDWAPTPGTIAEGFRRETGEVGRLMIPGMRGVYAREGDWGSPMVYVYLMVFAGVGWGWWRAARGLADPLVWMAPMYFAMFVLSKYDQGTRYLIPLVPVFWLCVWEGLSGKEGEGGSRWVAVRTVGLTVLIDLHVLVCVGDRVMRSRVVARENASWPALRELASEMGTGYAEAVHIKTGDERLLMLAYVTDRWVFHAESAERVPPIVRQVLVSAGEAAPVGFERVDEKVGLVLYRRSGP
jgi:hypothetical protein